MLLNNLELRSELQSYTQRVEFVSTLKVILLLQDNAH